ncbi:MAG TPA: hypothetical protein VIL43_08250 [Burkholderiales bacterium]
MQTLLGCTAALAPAAHVHAQSVAAATPGELVVEPPTLLSLGFEWYVEGDDDRDATVEVAFRVRGSAQWRRALSLLRISGERTVFAGALDYTAPNMFAGSVLNLEPDTEYDVRLTLADPDGVHGNAERIVTARTRKEPEPHPDGRVFHVYPAGYEGPKEEPAFIGLLAACYVAALGGDWSRASPPRVQPGDRIVVHAGVYKDDRTDYSHEIMSNYTTCCGTPWDGTYYLTQGGTAERPIAIVAAGDGEVVFDGDGHAARRRHDRECRCDPDGAAGEPERARRVLDHCADGRAFRPRYDRARDE